MHTWNCAEVLSCSEVQLLHHHALKILEEVGVLVQNRELLKLLAEWGACVDFQDETVHFPRPWVEQFIAEASDEYDDDDSLVVSCTLPYGKRREYARGIKCTAGTYPQYLLGMDGRFRPHTLATVVDMTRLTDALPNIDRLGVMGIPSDVPPSVDTLYMRLVAWKNAEHKLSGCGEVRDPRLIPNIFEMGHIFADYKKESATRYTFAEVELLSPLRLRKMEAEIFVQFWKAGYKAGIGSMPIAGASAPATLAGTLSLLIAESLFISVLYRACYGLQKLYMQVNSSVLDMKLGMFPFGRPERALLILAMGHMARHYPAGLWASAVHSDSKDVDIEAGYAASFNAIPAVLAGTLGLECYGLVSGAEANSPIQLVVDNEYLGAIKRFARGFDVNEDTLAFPVIRERGIGGSFLDSDHTLDHYRREHWIPELFSREPLNAWLESDRKTVVERAQEKADSILSDHHPQGMDEATERALLGVIRHAEKTLLV